MNQAWIHVYSGSYSSVLANQATLEACGIQTFVPDETTKVVDPCITGSNPVGAEIHVQEADFEAARQLLRPPISSDPPEDHKNILDDPSVLRVVLGIFLMIVVIALLVYFLT
jgi:hypothetical protein